MSPLRIGRCETPELGSAETRIHGLSALGYSFQARYAHMHLGLKDRIGVGCDCRFTYLRQCDLQHASHPPRINDDPTRPHPQTRQEVPLVAFSRFNIVILIFDLTRHCPAALIQRAMQFASDGQVGGRRCCREDEQRQSLGCGCLPVQRFRSQYSLLFDFSSF